MIEHVSPFVQDEQHHEGWQYTCDSCGWHSPVMAHRQGAERHEAEHVCAEVAE